MPRPGKVFADADYNQLELFSLGQICLDLFGESELAAVLNAGKDAHTALAADIMGVSYEEGAALKKAKDKPFDQARQTAKVANFGFPGGLGAAKLVLFARKAYKVVLTPERARELKQQWFGRWPEMRLFFDRIAALTSNPMGLGECTLPRVGMIRAGARFTELCNTHFQGLAAAAAKRAGWLIARACYTDRSSPLWNARPVNFIHDQWIVEVDDSPLAHDCAMELSRLMGEGARELLPDCTPKAEPLLARCWSKRACPVFDAYGRLVPWEPK